MKIIKENAAANNLLASDFLRIMYANLQEKLTSDLKSESLSFKVEKNGSGITVTKEDKTTSIMSIFIDPSAPRATFEIYELPKHRYFDSCETYLELLDGILDFLSL